MVQEQHRQFHAARWNGQTVTTETATSDTAPSGIPLDLFWALVDPLDRPDPRPDPRDA